MMLGSGMNGLPHIGTCLYAQKTVTTYAYHYQDAQARALNATASAYVKPMTVELEVLSDAPTIFRAQLTEDKYKELMGNGGDITRERVRAYVTFLYSENVNADIILSPVFNIDRHEGRGCDVTVKGVPAIYKNWKSATQADYEWIRLIQAEHTSDKEKTKAISSK